MKRLNDTADYPPNKKLKTEILDFTKELFFNIEIDDLVSVKYIIDKDLVDVNTAVEKTSKLPPIHYAASHNSMNVLTHFIKELDINPNSISTFAALQPLHVAAEQGALDAIEFLLNKGADIDALNGWGGTPLACAINKNQNEAAIILINQDANINSLEPLAATGNPLDLAIEHDNEEIINILLDDKYLTKDSISAALHAAVTHNRGIVLIERLVKMGADINSNIIDDENGNPSILKSGTDIETAKFILNSYKINYDNLVSAMVASAWRGDVSFMRLLLEKNVNLDDMTCESPLEAALSNDAENTLKFLLTHGCALINYSDKYISEGSRKLLTAAKLADDYNNGEFDSLIKLDSFDDDMWDTFLERTNFLWLRYGINNSMLLFIKDSKELISTLSISAQNKLLEYHSKLLKAIELFELSLIFIIEEIGPLSLIEAIKDKGLQNIVISSTDGSKILVNILKFYQKFYENDYCAKKIFNDLFESKRLDKDLLNYVIKLTYDSVGKYLNSISGSALEKALIDSPTLANYLRNEMKTTVLPKNIKTKLEIVFAQYDIDIKNPMIDIMRKENEHLQEKLLKQEQKIEHYKKELNQIKQHVGSNSDMETTAPLMLESLMDDAIKINGAIHDNA